MARSRRKNKFEQGRELLHPSNLAATLPCREKEYNDIYLFVKSSLLEQVGGCMFISGMPGSGKTATVHRIFQDITKDNEIRPMMSKKIKMFEINGLKLSDPNQFYAHFHYKIFGGKKKVSKNMAIEELEENFANPRPSDPFLVVLVDELDQLCTKKQNILYHLFDWPNRPDARLLILSIANTMNLPEQVMMSKIQSRLGLRRLLFHAYKYGELIKIVETRIGELDLFEEDDGVQLICRKVASLSGDARRVLDLCRRSMDIAEQQNDGKPIGDLKVSIKHVELAVREVFSSDKVYAIAESTEQEKIFLNALKEEFQSKEAEVAYFGDVYLHHIENCRQHKIYVPTVSELIEIANSLYAKRIILIEQNKLEVKSKISLNVSMDEIKNFLGQ